jgi:4-diphosphocytidyl-2-C-methyl-D-erythritol kinase
VSPAAPGPAIAVQTRAPAKINLTLEILGRREDGFHDLISVAQTLDLCDDVRLDPAPEGTDPSVRFIDDAGRPLPAPADVDGEIVARAWRALRQTTGRDLPGRVTIRKRLPVAGGLGGGSSDAAAFLRLADGFWGLGLRPEELAEVGAGLGSDVPLFLAGGATLIEGRGERVTPLPDGAAWAGLLFSPELPLPAAKTAAMFSALRPRHFGDGARGRALAATLADGAAPHRDDLVNTFDTVVGEVLLGVAAERRRFAQAARAVPLLAGAGPSLFLLGETSDAARYGRLAAQLTAGGGRARVVRPLARAAATAVRPAPAWR